MAAVGTWEEMEHRFKFHPANTELKANAHDEARAACLRLAQELGNIVPEGREWSVVLTKIEEAMFWANAGIARKVRDN